MREKKKQYGLQIIMVTFYGFDRTYVLQYFRTRAKTHLYYINICSIFERE